MAKDKGNIQDNWKRVAESKVDSPFEGKVVNKSVEGKDGEDYSVRKNMRGK